MFVSDLRGEFYDKIKHRRVLLLVAVDVDATCTCKILQSLFECDQTQYTVVPVTGKTTLETAYLEHSEQVKHVIFVNCGGTIDVVDVLQPEEGVTFYILDSHRPVDVTNIYNSKEVILLMKEEEEEGIPAFADIFQESDDEEEEDEEDDDEEEEDEASDSLSSPKKKRSRNTESELLKKREKRLWEERREEILFNYSQFTYYGTASSVTAFELAWKLSKDNVDILWWSILGLTEQYYRQQIETDRYMQVSQDLQTHVVRLNRGQPLPTDGTTNTSLLSVNCMRITCDTEVALYLYRHWTIFDSLLHSDYVACQLKLWSVKGMKTLHDFLANAGLPLVEVKQVFHHMDTKLKDNMKEWVEAHAPKYGLDNILYDTFHTQYGYRHRFSAMDMVLAVSALLETNETSSGDQRDNFLKALDSLSRGNVELVYKGLSLAKHQLKAVLNTVHTFVNTHQILSAGPFLYAVIPEGNVDSGHFTKPSCLLYLARFLRNAQVACSKRNRAAKLPLVLATPLNREQETCLVVGIPPLIEASPKNFFGKAFEHAAEVSKSRTFHNNFDTSVIEMKSEDLSKFLDALTSAIQPI